MRWVKDFKDLKQVWMERVTQHLIRGDVVEASVLTQIGKFFDFLYQSCLTGDLAGLTTLLDEWIESDILRIFGGEIHVNDLDTGIARILDEILLATYETIREYIGNGEGLSAIGVILPIYSNAYRYITQIETKRKIDLISNELEKAKVTLENLDRNKSDFISVAAHELKTPLTLIEGYSSMLREEFSGKGGDIRSEIYLRGMENGIRRLQEIIDDMIDVSLIDNNMLKLNFQPLWIKQLLEIARNELSGFAEARKQVMEFINFDGSDEMIYGDPERLYQALRHLLTNAIKYTPDGGKITLDGRILPGFIEITIRDTGIGIDKAYHKTIFDKFGRLGNLRLHSSGKIKFKGGGPGLGLPITKGLIEAHGGTIWVESDGYDEEKCPGTTFHVLLPKLDESPDKKYAKLFQPLSKLTAEKGHVQQTPLDDPS